MAEMWHDPERAIDLDLVRCTENAALAAWKWFGKGDKNQADFAATDAMRGMFHLINCKGLVRIGEGRKDKAPGIFTNEKLGNWKAGSIPMAITVDPIDGTTLTSKGLPGAISVLAAVTCENPDDDPRDLLPAVPSQLYGENRLRPAGRRECATRRGLGSGKRKRSANRRADRRKPQHHRKESRQTGSGSCRRRSRPPATSAHHRSPP